MARIPLEPLGRPLRELLSLEEREANLAAMRPLEERLRERRAAVRAGWGPRYAERVHARGKLTTWERAERLKDPDSPVLGIGTFVNWGRRFEGSRREAPGAGVLTALLRVHGRWVVLVANDNLVASGAWWPGTPEKIQRAQELALRLRLPVVYLVESSGLFLPQQAGSFAGRHGAGGIFRMNARLAQEGVPQLAGVFGPCIAGGGYMPIISDFVVMTEQSYMVIAGDALIRGAKAQRTTSLDIGGPEVHVHQSGCADQRVPDDEAALEVLRRKLAGLPSSAVPFYRASGPLPPAYPPEELSALLPADHRQSYDVRELLARLLDGGLFHEVLPERGLEVVTGVGRVSGLWVGIAANQQEPFPHPHEPGRHRRGGILYREGVCRLATFARHCQEDGIPLFWFQDVSGFDIGPEAEAEGLLGYGSSLIYTNSQEATPVFTVLLRKASGAGYYAQAGLPYRPLVQLATPLSRLAVMEGRTAALGTYARYLDAEGRVAVEDPAERERIERGMREVAERLERDMDPYAAASRRDVDELVSLPELRTWLEALAEASYQSTGRRVRNPRIWSLHDLEVLCTGP